jgi:myxalamid-type polyketide synthase MxaE and MxaD
LVTGGLGGLGAQLALRLASAGATHLVLVVKRALPAREDWDKLTAESSDFARVATIRKLEALGAKVTTLAADLADDSALESLWKSFDLSAYPLRGVWHTALSYSSAPLAELSSDAVRTMIQVKSAAAWRLHEWTRQQQLDYFVLFSSTTALWGATGLAHYAAANAMLDALAHLRRGQGLPATVVNWGTWQQMRGLSNDERARAARVGLRPMPAEAALAALERVLDRQTCQAIVADIDWNAFKAAYESRRRRPLLDRLGAKPATKGPEEEPISAPASLLADRLSAAAADERRELLAQHVQRLLVAVLGSSADGFIDRRKGFFELGMDSLTSVQMRRRLEAELRRSLPSTLTFNYPTIDLLTDYLLRDSLAAAETDAGDSSAAAPGQLLAPVAATALREAAPAPVAPAEIAAPAVEDSDATEDELFERLAARLVQRRG